MSAGKILFLHGYTQSGPVFAKRSAGLRKALGKLGFTTHYATAPISRLVPLDAPEEERQALFAKGFKEEDSYAWFVQNDATGEYDGIEESWDVLKSYIEKEGPFVGVVGFSQGAVLGSMLVHTLSRLAPTQEGFKFAVLVSGFRARCPGSDECYPITIPTLHVMGEADTIVSNEKSQTLVDACVEDQRKVYVHAGGHFVPSNKDAVSAVTGFIKEVLKMD
ncbi:serine hydrolase FSH [Kockiozyma suomiensis]|uniref:serine hydrolase FSH n=1 Tax=Kockiozyma suomiensis TaxID=1337062 RepID=UPI003343DBA4